MALLINVHTVVSSEEVHVQWPKGKDKEECTYIRYVFPTLFHIASLFLLASILIS